MQRCTSRRHSPWPQLTRSAGLSRFWHPPAIVPLHVPAMGVWQAPLQVICAEPRGCIGQSVAGGMHAPAPLHAATESLTAMRLKQLVSPGPKPS